MSSFDFNRNNSGDVFVGGNARAIDQGLRTHMQSVYNYMSIGLAISGLIAYFIGTSAALSSAIFGSPLKWLVMLAPLGFILVMGFKMHKMSAQTAKMTFFAFSAIMGLSLATIFLVFTSTSILRVFFITSAMFAATSLYGYVTKRDLSGMGSFLIMGAIGLMIASIVNMFLGSSMLQFIVSALGVVIFTGLTAYDTQRIKENYAESFGHETNDKMAVMGALSLYLNFINMLQFMLQFLGDRR